MHSPDDAPLHQRFDKRKALVMALNRYRIIRARIPAQVSLLQESSAFREQCAKYYKEGRPDWSILVAIYGAALNVTTRQMNLPPTIAGSPETLRKIEELLKERPAPAYLFTDEVMRSTFATQPVAILESWGFKVDRREFRPETLEWFLEKRLPVFSCDLPHTAMFGDPPGDWPESTAPE
jgi:hypothetical protein